MVHISENELKFLRLLERTKRLTKEDLKSNVWKVSMIVYKLPAQKK